MSDTPASVIRAWARENGIPVGSRGRIGPDVKAAYAAAHPEPLAEWERELLEGYEESIA